MQDRRESPTGTAHSRKPQLSAFTTRIRRGVRGIPGGAARKTSPWPSRGRGSHCGAEHAQFNYQPAGVAAGECVPSPACKVQHEGVPLRLRATLPVNVHGAGFSCRDAPTATVSRLLAGHAQLSCGTGLGSRLSGVACQAHAIPRADVAMNEPPEFCHRCEPEHRLDLLQGPAFRLRHATEREGHDDDGDGAEKQQGAAGADGPRDHRGGDEGADDIRGTPIHARAEAHGLAADAQGHDLRDVEPSPEAPRDPEGEHESDNHDDDHLPLHLGHVAVALVRDHGDRPADEHRHGHARHPID
mmetsp:Transcript_16663/g.33836  ORF Transcript_16663/g.33836 Transcript_16663/m.33836 type:complete len:300 (+) Transcript_16663:130-1029(+)